jgi:hypothetical protein
MRIVLFTPFSPDLGGGAAQLRSHLAQMAIPVDWFYLANQAAASGTGKLLGPRFTPSELIVDLSARTGFLPGSRARAKELVEKIGAADMYWVVAHYEGIAVAAELCAQGKKVHVTVHDDPFGTWMRSNRYVLFRPLLWRTFPELLRAAQSIDVTSWGMRNLYRKKYGVKCFSLYLHVEQLPKLDVARNPSQLAVGHIGTLYQAEPFRRFVLACKKVAAERKRKLRIVRIGASPELDAFAAHHPDVFESHGDLSERQALPLLAGCDFHYAMYPAGRKYELFRRTSLPIKLSSYVQSQRPIFAHTPGDSTLACVIRKHGLGTVCDDAGIGKLAGEIRKLLSAPVSLTNFESARADVMGLPQVQQLEAALRGGNWEHIPESDC